MRAPSRVPWSPAWFRWGWLWLAALAAGTAWAVDDRNGDWAEAGETELRTKAVYLYQLGAFVAWPARAFPAVDSPVVIGLLEAEALADELSMVVDGRSLQGRPVAVRKLHVGDPLGGVHVLFLGRGVDAQVVEAISALRGQPVLTVADTVAPAGVRSIIRFLVADGRLRFDVSLKAAEQASLGISARLLAVAHRVDTGTAP